MKRLLAALLLASVATSAAASDCMPRADMVSVLLKEYGEAPAFQGLAPVSMFEIFLEAESGTWTLVVTSPNGVACHAASGNAGTILTPPPAGEPS